MRLCLALGLAALLLAVSGLYQRPAAASVARALALEELTTSAEDILVARREQSSSRYEDGRIVTDLRLRVLEAVKGEARPGATLTLTVLGGVVGDIGMRVPGAARIAPDGEVVLFATARPDGRRRAVGLSQGVLPITREGGEAVVHPGGQGLALVGHDRRSRAAGALPGPRPLEDLLAELRLLVAEEAR